MSKARPTQYQMKFLVDLMANDPQLCSGKFSKSFTHKIAQHKWENIAVQLNALPGAEKSWDKWKKTWQDTRNVTKSKAAAIKRHFGGTGGGPSCSIELNEIQKETLPLLSQASISGHTNSLESIVEFDFNNTTKDVINYEALCVEEFVEPIISSSDCGNENPQSSINEADISSINEADISTVNENLKRKKTVASKLNESNATANRLCDIAERKCGIKEVYYQKKIKLLEEKNNTLKNIETLFAVFIDQKLNT